ncbi:MAG TPA: DUF4747 family protein, partial [Terriglobia bacterium]|nr:DUF4747 family protein [Terriglobia bacterium]
PHSAERYLSAFNTLNDAKPRTLYHAHRQIELGTLRALDDDRLPDAITGYFYIFSKVNFNDPWLNTIRNDQATEEELRALNIPRHLAPEFRRFRYVFDPHRHRLFFETFTRERHYISPRAFGSAVGRLLQTVIPEAFDEVNAVVIPDQTAVDNILDMNRLRKLSLVINRPNPDDDEFETEFLGELDEENVGTVQQVLIKAPGVPAIIPNMVTRQLAHLAAKFGFAEGWGKNAEGASIRRDTEQSPKEHTVVFADTEDSLDKAIEFIAQQHGDDGHG